MVDMQPSFSRLLLADAAPAVLLGEHLVVITCRDVVAALEVPVADVLGLVEVDVSRPGLCWLAKLTDVHIGLMIRPVSVMPVDAAFSAAHRADAGRVRFTHTPSLPLLDLCNESLYVL